MSLKWLPLLIAPALLAIACGGDGSSPTPSPAPSSSPGVTLPSPTPEPTPPILAGWVECGLPLLTPGCEATVTNVSPQRLNVREDPGPDQAVIDALSQGDTVCLVGSPVSGGGFRWWPVRSAEGTEGWVAALDPDEPDEPWLTPAGRVCDGEQIAGVGPLSQEAPSEGTFLIDLAAERWLRVLPSYSDSLVAISPDGNTIIYHLAGGLAAFDLDSADLRQLGDGHSAAFSPDGGVLALWGEQPQVTLIPWPDGEPVEVGIPGAAGRAVWSGTTLAVSTAEGIYFITADGTALRATNQAADGFAWARHQSLLSFWTSDQDGSILSIVAPGEEPRVLGQLSGERVQGVSWSSDGSLLAAGFTHPAPPPPQPGELFDVRVIDVASGRTRFTITGAGHGAMVWSPVESLLLLSTLCSEKSQLVLINGDGSDLRPLGEAQNGTPFGHAWSPEGQEVATAWVERNAVTAVNVESGETRTLIRGPGLIAGVQWVAADRLLVTTIPGTGPCDGVASQPTQVVFP